MSDLRFYSIDVTIQEDGNTVLEFNKSGEDGIKSHLTDPFLVTSSESLGDALRYLADNIEGGQVEFFEDDEEEAHESTIEEPPAGSVVMLHGDGGTAYQRHYSTGRWHSASEPEGLQWHEVLSENNEVLPLTIHIPKED